MKESDKAKKEALEKDVVWRRIDSFTEIGFLSETHPLNKEYIFYRNDFIGCIMFKRCE